MRVGRKNGFGVLEDEEAGGAVFDGHADGEDDCEGELEPEAEGPAGGGFDAVVAGEEVGFVSGLGGGSGCGWR